jgi:D-3-phosphoglycerate dehydrogenase
MKHRVLCCALSSDQGPHIDMLPDHGFGCDVVDPAIDLTVADNLRDCLQGYAAVIAGSEPYPAEVIEGCPELRVIARAGVGFDAVDLEACDRQGIVLTTTPGVNHHAVAEQTIALLVSLGRKVVHRDRQVRSEIWERQSGPRIWGQTLGLIGFGRIGQAVAVRGNGLGMNVIAVDPFAVPELAKEMGVQLVDLPQLLSGSDYISLHSPVDEQTFQMINASTIAQMKPGVRLINTARGQLIDEPALITALQSGRVGGAGLDVFDAEPLSADSPLIGLDNVILSGHIAGLDDESHRDTYLMIVDTLVSLRDGEWPQEQIRNLAGVTGWAWE